MSDMINDLNESLKGLIQIHAEDLGQPAILFEVPSRDWNVGGKLAINFHFFDIRENLVRRENQWVRSDVNNGKAEFYPRPMRLDLSYLVTCWGGKPEDHYKLLWGALELLTLHSPIPNDLLQGDLKKQMDRVPTQVAQPDGVLQNLSEFWTALGNQVRPSISLVATLELQKAAPPIPVVKSVSDRVIHIRQGAWALRVRVRDGGDRPVAGAEVMLDGTGRASPPHATALPDASDGYVFRIVPKGKYTVRVAAAGLQASQEVEVLADESGAEVVCDVRLAESAPS